MSASLPVMTLTPAERMLIGFIRQQAELERSFDRWGTVDWTYRSVYDFLLAHGQWCTPAALPSGVGPMPERHCYANARRTELAYPSLVYTEGWAVSVRAGTPFAHGWCTTAEGVAVDPTWSWSGAGGSAYFGVLFTDSALRPCLDGGGVLEDPETAFPLLRDGWPLEQPLP